MKEYIDKKDMIDQFFGIISEEEAREQNIGNIVTFEDIDRLTSFTQSEIESLAYNRGVRAFAEKLKDELTGVHPEIFNNAKYSRQDIIDFINGTLNEMGCFDE